MAAVTSPWWRDSVFYEVYLRSFADGSGDGLGDLAGVRSRLPYLRDLGVDALWLTPFYPSPMVDHGYDVADYCAVDPRFGQLATVDTLLADAHALGLRVTIDLVPNHTSDQHPWFRAALAAGRNSPQREWYIFRDGRGPGGAQPPNNWESGFSRPAWTRVPDGQWYLHLFAREQPDLNWRNPQVGDAFAAILRFWLDRGVDGFRIDVAHGLVKDARLRDNPGRRHPGVAADGSETVHSWNQPEVHEIFRRWRGILDSYPGDRMAIGEAWVMEEEGLARYVRPDELHQAFNFRWLSAGWSAPALRGAIDRSLLARRRVGATATWVLSNHDLPRHLTRYGGGAVGCRRARAAALLLLALPGSAYLYQGEELGLPEVELPEEALRDPVWERSGRRVRGRDGCRVPLPWSGTKRPYGFCPDGVAPWLPQPADWAGLTAAAQAEDPASMLSLYRTALRLRGEWVTSGADEVRWLESPGEVIAFRRGSLGCLVNLGGTPVRLPAPAELLLASGPTDGGELPTDTAAWLRLL